ncbi:MAG TPA: VOC family protein [Polyangia bacterium]|jgi:PhnB protein
MLSVHLMFAGQCEEAFRFYERTFAASRLTLVRYRDTPAAADVPEDFRDKLVHATLVIGGQELAGADVVPELHQSMRGFSVLFSAATQADAERIFAALADGGAVHMALQQTFWSPAFGVLVDRFGTPWEITATAA